MVRTAKKKIDCGCPRVCDPIALKRSNSHFRCGDRIRKLMEKYKINETKACEAASDGSNAPCGPECRPTVCKNMTEFNKNEILDSLSKFESEKKVSNLSSDNNSERDGDDIDSIIHIDCGCPLVCDSVALNKGNPHFRCGSRITALMKKYEINETKACETASNGNDAPCGSECRPTKCKKMKKLTKDAIIASLSKSEWPDPPFEKYEGVAVVTKVLWPEDLDLLKQMLCLFTAAYNRHHNYDIIVFTTLPWDAEKIKELQDFALPAKLSVEMDSPSLSDHLDKMTEDEIKYLKRRCGVEPNKKLTWFHHCSEPDYPKASTVPLAYGWQAEFRAYHIWKHPALSKYKYMMWLDSDALCTKNWDRDPMKYMVENDLVVMFDNFPQGSTSHKELNEKMMKAYGRKVCYIGVNEAGTFYTKPCEQENEIATIGHIHGFHHITNLDFYRSEKNLKALGMLIENKKFSRFWDDQLAVTYPAAMEAPERSWDYRANGLNFGIHHNGQLDGKEKNDVFGYITWFNNNKKGWEAGMKLCDGYMVSHG
uniref:Uncharacterized protein n=1 Tax=Corethron hystrix TaxID=216773 RepID=A0A7S1BQT7_9STRA|mmetsp:Transcript_35989/g.84019  ORF Transcript_35989/g.84019 Transcript_35989/m.84019 type:complete len:538 (+) Transcript_35989:485-2098(+)